MSAAAALGVTRRCLCRGACPMRGERERGGPARRGSERPPAVAALRRRPCGRGSGSGTPCLLQRQSMPRAGAAWLWGRRSDKRCFALSRSPLSGLRFALGTGCPRLGWRRTASSFGSESAFPAADAAGEILGGCKQRGSSLLLHRKRCFVLTASDVRCIRWTGCIECERISK